LGINKKKNLIIIGFSNIGQAVTKYLTDSLIYKIINIYDKDSQKIGTKLNNLIIKDVSEINSQDNIDFAIITVPASVAQRITNILIKNDIKGILNFAPTHINSPNNIFYREIDMIKQLNILSGNSTLLNNS